MFPGVVHILGILHWAAGPAVACTCADENADPDWQAAWSGVHRYPAAGDEVAADVAVYWRGAQDGAAFELTGSEGNIVFDVEWWVSGTPWDVAVIRPQYDLLPTSAYEFFDGTDSTAFSTGSLSVSPAAADADVSSVCVEVASEYSGDCMGTTFSLGLPPLASGYYLAELTNEAGSAYRVLGDGDGVEPYRGFCESTFLDASGWESASVRVAAVSLAGDLGAWSSTFSGDMPAGGTECLAVAQVDDGDEECGCGSTSGAAPVALLAAALAAAVRRRRAGARQGESEGRCARSEHPAPNGGRC